MTDCKTIAFLSAPGGVGKTTIALNLAWFLKERGKIPLLIDLDPSLGLTLHFKDFRDYKKEIEDKKRTSADFLEVTIEEGSSKSFDFKYFPERTSFQGVTLEFIASSLRLENVMAKIWYNPTSGRREMKLKEALGLIPGDMPYEYILLDNIPCYSLSYALTTLFASDVYIIPLRLTISDLGRTMGMIKKLQETAKRYELNEAEFENKLYFAFNRVEHFSKSKITKYKKDLQELFPGATIFEQYISQQVGFSRVGTDEEKSGDPRMVRDKFTPFYKEFKDKIMK